MTSLVNIKELSTKSGIDYFKVYKNLKCGYRSLTSKEKTQLANIAHEDLNEFFNKLGFKVSIDRIV